MSTIKTTSVSIEHVVITSDKSYEQVKTALEARLGSANDMDERIAQLASKKLSWQDATHIIEKQIGSSGFSIFGEIDHGQLLALAGKPSKAVQYTIGNPLLAQQMTQHILAAALYAPFKLLLYENEHKKAVIAYDRFSSFLEQFGNDEVTHVAKLVDEKLEAMLTAVV